MISRYARTLVLLLSRHNTGRSVHSYLCKVRGVQRHPAIKEYSVYLWYGQPTPNLYSGSSAFSRDLQPKRLQRLVIKRCLRQIQHCISLYNVQHHIEAYVMTRATHMYKVIHTTSAGRRVTGAKPTTEGENKHPHGIPFAPPAGRASEHG